MFRPTYATGDWYVRIHVMVNLYLYIPLHAPYTRTYIVHIYIWYQVVRACNPMGACVLYSAYITTKLHEVKTALESSKGQWRANYGTEVHALSVTLQGQTWMHTPMHTPTHTKEEITILLNNGTLWVNFLGIFSRAPAHRRPLDTERLCSFAPNSAPHYYTSPLHTHPPTVIQGFCADAHGITMK